MSNISTLERMGLLVDINVSMTKYSNSNVGGNWRPAIQDYCTFHTLVNMYDSDMSDEQPEYVWKSTPDEIIYYIVENNHSFVIDFGWEDLDESVRDFVVNKEFVISADDLTEDEYNQLIERSK